MKPIHLSAHNFIKALQGKQVPDEQTNKLHCFLCKGADVELPKYDKVVVIDGVLVSEVVMLGATKPNESLPDFSYPVVIRGGTFERWFVILPSHFQEDFCIAGGNFQGNFRVAGGLFSGNFNILGGNFEASFQVLEGKFLSTFRIAGGRYAEGLLVDNRDASHNSYIQHLIFDLPAETVSKIVIEEGTAINKLTFRGSIAPQGRVYVYPIVLEQLIFENFVNHGNFRMIGVRGYFKGGLLQITHSNLGEAVFGGVKFDSFGFIIINNSKLSQINTTEKHLPAKARYLGNALHPDEGLIRLPEKIADIYRQLHVAMRSRGFGQQQKKYYRACLVWGFRAALELRQPGKAVWFALRWLLAAFRR